LNLLIELVLLLLLLVVVVVVVTVLVVLVVVVLVVVVVVVVVPFNRIVYNTNYEFYIVILKMNSCLENFCQG